MEFPKKRPKLSFFSRHHFLSAVLIVLSIGFISASLLLLWAVNLKIPDFSGFEERKVAQSTKIYDRTGEILLFDVQENIRRTIVSGDKISRHIKNATVAIEDKEFYQHNGIKPKSIVRAFLANLQAGDTTQGGSTITQQVIKNALLTKEKRYSRKVKEALLSVKLEGVMEKDEILTLYLNESPYGGTIYGVEEASQRFFGKPSSDVTLAEAAYLAALPKAPSYYSPYGSNIEELTKRKNLVLDLMEELGFATSKEVADAKKELVTFLPEESVSIKAPHFVFYVKDLLEKEYGREKVELGGLKVVTTLDWELQQKAEEVVKEIAPINEENFNAKNAGVIAIEPGTSDVLVMVGSRDYFESENDGNFNVTTAHRQPGSAFKPFVYATALKKGYRPETIVFDLETQFETACSADGIPLSPDATCYTPGNYDDIFRGPISMRDALAQSVNIPAIKFLYLAGLRDSLQTARDFGISSLTSINRYGLTLVLGGGEVSLLEMTNAYATFAAEGNYTQERAILRVEDAEGNVLHEAKATPKRVMDENIALTISDMLSDNEARAPAFGYNSSLHVPGYDVAVKTGTTNDYKDMWIVGYTPNLALGAWVGNNDNTSLEKKVAGLVVAPLWRKILDQIVPTRDKKSFKPPRPSRTTAETKPIIRGVWQGTQTYTVDTVSGKLATEHTPEETKEERVVPNAHSIIHWVDKKNPLGPIPTNPMKDPQYLNWEIPVIKWAALNGYFTTGNPDIPTEYDDVHLPELAPKFRIVSPNTNQLYNANERIFANFMVEKTSFPISHAEFFLGNEFLGKTNFPLTTFSFVPAHTEGVSASNDLRIVVYDSMLNRSEATVTFRVSQ